MLPLCAAAFRPLRRLVPPDLRRKPVTVIAAAAALAVATIPARADDMAASSSGLSVFSIIAHTPLWAWVVLAGLVWLGIMRMKDREVGLRGLVLFPLILVALSIYNLVATGQPLAALAGAGIGGLLGAAAGLYLERRYPPVPMGDGRLRLKGEWTSLLVVLTVFIIRYVAAVTGAVDPAFAHSDGFVLVTAGLSGCFVVMLVTRTLLRVRLALAPANSFQGEPM